MSFPPQPPRPPISLNYETSSGYGKASILINIAVILNLIAAIIDVSLYGIAILMEIVSLIMMRFVYASSRSATMPGMPGMSDFQWLMLVIKIVIGLPLIVAASLKFVAWRRLRNNSANAWGWGFTAGIVGCAEFPFLCVQGCLVIALFWIPLGVGIYTITILCFENVRRYLQDRRGTFGFEPLAFPTQPPPP